jgi:hypothetical protein
MERTREEVKEFVLDKVKAYMNKILAEEVVGVDESLVDSVYADIEDDKMLYRHQAKWLENMLENECKFLHDHTYREGSSYILHIDSLGIYADAWAWYCRPGTYRIPV